MSTIPPALPVMASLSAFQILLERLVHQLNPAPAPGQCMAMYEAGNKALKALAKEYHRLALAARKADDDHAKGTKRAIASDAESERQATKKSTRKAEKKAARDAARKEPREKYTRAEVSDEPNQFPPDDGDDV